MALQLQFVEHQTPELCLAAVTQNGWALLFVKQQTSELCLAAMTQNGKALRYVKDQTSELCLAAMTQRGWALQYVKRQTPEMCLIALALIVGRALGYIHPRLVNVFSAQLTVCQLATSRGWLTIANLFVVQFRSTYTLLGDSRI